MDCRINDFEAMLNFDNKGHLKPYESIVSTIDELKNVFVDGIKSDLRLENFEKYIHYSNNLKSLLGGISMKQWVNGSFATKKINPKDIDVVTFIDYKLIKKHEKELIDFRADNSWKIYGVDAYIIELNDVKSERYRFTKSDIAYWHNLFTTARRNRQGQKSNKGFLEIFY